MAFGNKNIKIDSKTEDIELLFENSWEVCNKVGGIYTVLSTKARELVRQFGDNLIFVGPDIWSDDNPSPYFRENKKLLKSASIYMKLPEGISIRTGRWDIPGSPIVVLVKYDSVYPLIDEIYGTMWENFKVDSLPSYGDYRESCVFAVASAMVMNGLIERMGAKPDKVVAHFDEWTTGMGLLYLRLTNPDVATVFTTHATSIGRSICGNGKPLYQYFHNYLGDQMAQELNMVSKHSLEKAAAHAADCFTTVSEVTADECEQLLEIRPQIVTPNGFDASFVPSEQVRATQRVVGRKRILEIVNILTGKQITGEPFIIATSGRNEFRNKGIDLYLDTLATLRAGEDNKSETVIGLVLVPAWVKEPDSELLLNLNKNRDAHPNSDCITHRLHNEESDAILGKIRYMGGNSDNSNIIVLYIPCYLDGKDGILNISYYDLLPALDLTLFPSYYEPWGYTPLESIAFGIPTVTTDKAGFGKWIEKHTPNTLEECGVKVLPRNDNDYDEVVNMAAGIIESISRTTYKKREKISAAAIRTARKADWSLFISLYDETFRIALKRRNLRLSKSSK